MFTEALIKQGLYVENASMDSDLEERLEEAIKEVYDIIDEHVKRKSLCLDDMSDEESTHAFGEFITIVARLAEGTCVEYDDEMDELEEPENEEEA